MKMITRDMFEEWLDEFFPDEESLLNSAFIKFTHVGYEVVVSNIDIILGEGVPYYCVSERFGISVYCFVKKADDNA